MNVITEKIKLFERKFIFPIRFKSQRKKNRNLDFTIIADNCWGGRIYQELGVSYQSPFIGLFLFKDDYLKLLKNLKYYLELEVIELHNSKYVDNPSYPVGILGDIELHFLHYKNFAIAKKKWDYRKQRMNFDNLFIKMNDDDLFKLKHATEFQNLPFKKKVFLSAQKYDVECNVVIKSLYKQKTIKNGQDLKKYHNYFDVVKWLNEK